MHKIIFLLSVVTVALAFDPKYSEWGPWSAPELSCGSGPQVIFRTRTCLNSRCAPRDLVDRRTIRVPLCPINGGWSEWSDWTMPTETCGFIGLVFQTRECNNPAPQNGGLTCAGRSENSQEIIQPDCVAPAPIINGEWSDWSAWSIASKTCCPTGSTETLFRTRTCNNPEPSPDGGACIGQSRETKTVQIPKCATYQPAVINGGFGEWSQWSLPSMMCSDSVVFVHRHRDCNRPSPSNGGLPCQGDTDEEKVADVPPCSTPPSIVDGQWSAWSAWSRTSKTCCPNGSSETVFRTRTCNNPEPSDGGIVCEGVDRETKVVQIPRCQTYGIAKVNGAWGPWTEWTTPTQSCSETGVAVVTRRRTCVFPSVGARGNDCVGEAFQMKNVALPNCIINGEWSDWSMWSIPTISCSSSGKATVERTRICQFPPDSPDTIVPCDGEAIERKVIALPFCATYQPAAIVSDGVWGAWSSWSTPAESCVIGDPIKVIRTRQCMYTPRRTHGNACVGNSMEVKDADLPICSTPAPILDGVWSDWVESFPSATCSPTGFIIVHLTRLCMAPTPDAQEFTQCFGPDTDQRQHPVPFCRVVGVWGPWTAFGSPAISCDDSRQTIVTRSRKCLFSAHGDALTPCVGLALEGKLVILPRCSPITIEVFPSYRATAAPIEETTTVMSYRAPSYQAKITPAPIEETTTVMAYRAPSYHAKNTPAPIEETSTVRSYRPAYQTHSTPAQIVETTTARSYKPSYQTPPTPPPIIETTTVKTYRPAYQTMSTPAPIVETTAYKGYDAPKTAPAIQDSYNAPRTAPPIIETTVYQGYKAPKTAAPIIDTTTYKPRITAAPIVETTTTAYEEEYYEDEK